MADLLDVNVWLALAVAAHPHHKAARKAWTDLNQPAFCRITHLGWMRLLCNPQVMGKGVLDLETALEGFERLLAGGAVRLLDEPAGLQSHLKVLTRGATATRDFWTDAYLAAFAKSAALRMVTFDAGFARFKDLEVLVLSGS
jgi:uncharacterized protein